MGVCCHTASRTRYDILYRYCAWWAYQPVCIMCHVNENVWEPGTCGVLSRDVRAIPVSTQYHEMLSVLVRTNTGFGVKLGFRV